MSDSKSGHAPAALPPGAEEDLFSRLRVQPEAGHIWLDSRRMFLLHSGAFGNLRRELIEALGVAKVRGMLTRMGYQAGSRDAELAKKIRGGLSYFERYSVGPRLHALEGVARVEAVRVEVDMERGRHEAEFLWHHSIEAEAHVAVYGVGADAVCWMQIGYACGYASAFMGRPILYRELECRAQGRVACRILGKPVEEWQDADEDLWYLRAQSFVDKTIVDFGAAPAAPGTDATQGPAPRVLVGASAGFNLVCHSIRRVAPTDAPVLIGGESGVGKEMFARALHAESRRARKPFVALNCAAIPDQLIEAELFGVEKGAYTGAIASRPGRFERAHGGTLFLDELGCMSLAAQSKLLRAVQEGEIERVGGVRPRIVDVRIVAASNEDLREAVAQKRFREDLFYRLNVFPVHIPPLRERQEDIAPLTAYFLERLAKRHRRRITGLTDQALDLLIAHAWPGNVRELENALERAVILAQDGQAIDLCHLSEIAATAHRPAMLSAQVQGYAPLAARPLPAECAASETPMPEAAAETAPHPVLNQARAEVETIRLALERHRGNLSAAARELQLTRAQIAYRAAKLGLQALVRRRS
ncbi:regulatory protein, Fis family [Solimonas aquatica]|uniref:Regulatory protein, Fis family n=1 Tax=Solimonas aquatica TaxID=489703 RepID=A0A1H9BHY1_9GAMM|nr:sigma-54-dependent Fis family transcriptional regulator [Solimonas aquatica]SEP88602.1 regulatory protein, Fis family [Solimonas aquatica]